MSRHVYYHNVVFNVMKTMLVKYKAHYNKKLDENEKRGKIKRCVHCKSRKLLTA